FIFGQIFGTESEMPIFILCIYLILITGPLYLGGAMFLIALFRRKETSAVEIFYGFERFGKATGLYIMTTIFTILWCFLLVIPGYIAAIRYSMSFFILADNPNIGIFEAINESKRIMGGNKWKFFCLYLSFIGWGILGSITIVGSLFVMPYLYITLVAFYDIANGSLRSVRTIDGYTDVRSDNAAARIDPITVYKDDSVASQDMEKPEITEPEATNAVEPEATNAVEPEVPAIEEAVPAPDQENTKTEE
ncbi:MAG: DUF975 family protein, partial [Bacillota bacterium]